MAKPRDVHANRISRNALDDFNQVTLLRCEYFEVAVIAGSQNPVFSFALTAPKGQQVVDLATVEPEYEVRVQFRARPKVRMGHVARSIIVHICILHEAGGIT